MPPRSVSDDGSDPHSHSQSPDDSYFNDLSQKPASSLAPNEQQPKSKRMACVLCRKRKLRCDGARPACATCARLSHDCTYDETRKKSGPKRGYVKALEARLAQVETMLKTQDPASNTTTNNLPNGEPRDVPMQSNPLPEPVPELTDIDVEDLDNYLQWNAGDTGVMSDFPSHVRFIPDQQDATSNQPPLEWGSLIGLDIEEPFPAQDSIDELHQIYFEKVHPTLPIIHRPRYLVSMNNSLPKLRPPVSLQYIIWAFAASVSDKYECLQRQYYERSRYYFERDEMRGQGETMISLQHVQALLLISSYEFKFLMFPRAWSSTGRSCRLSSMLGLNRCDGAAMDVKMSLPPAKDCIEQEERRRAFWLCFCEDRYASIGTGWPMSVDERDIATNLPVSEEAFERGIAEPSVTLEHALKPGGAAQLSPLGGVCVLACLFGRNLLHLHRPTHKEDDGDLDGEFWKRHRGLDNILLSVSMALPEHLRIPMGVGNPNLVFMNMCLHTSTICLHQAAIFKAEKHRMPPKISAESKVRCIAAAVEIASIMKLSSHQDMAGFNPFTCFCLYVSTRVFVQYLKSRPADEQIKSSLYFMLSAMYAMKRKNPLAESFLVQLDVDLEAAGLDEMRELSSEASTALFSPRGQGCPMEQILSSVEFRTTPPASTNDEFVTHTAPTLNDFRDPKRSSQNGFPKQSNNRAAFHGLIPRNLDATQMAARPESPSTSQSPRNLYSEGMDMNGNVSASTTSNGQSPASLQNGSTSSSHVSSSSSFTSPQSLSFDDPKTFFVQHGRQLPKLRPRESSNFASNTRAYMAPSARGPDMSSFNNMAGADHDMPLFTDAVDMEADTLTANLGNFDFAQFQQMQQDMRSTGFHPSHNDGGSGAKTDMALGHFAGFGAGMNPGRNAGGNGIASTGGMQDLESLTDQEWSAVMNGMDNYSQMG